MNYFLITREFNWYCKGAIEGNCRGEGIVSHLFFKIYLIYNKKCAASTPELKGLKRQEENISPPCFCVVWILCQWEKKLGEDTTSLPSDANCFLGGLKIIAVGKISEDWEKLDLPKSRNNSPEKLICSVKICKVIMMETYMLPDLSSWRCFITPFQQNKYFLQLFKMPAAEASFLLFSPLLLCSNVPTKILRMWDTVSLVFSSQKPQHRTERLASKNRKRNYYHVVIKQKLTLLPDKLCWYICPSAFLPSPLEQPQYKRKVNLTNIAVLVPDTLFILPSLIPFMCYVNLLFRLDTDRSSFSFRFAECPVKVGEEKR